MSTKAKRERVRHLTYFVVQTYRGVSGARGKVTADQPHQARDQEHAMRLFERYKPIRAGVVAFHRTGDPATGDWEEAVIIAQHGVVPSEDVEGMEDATEEAFDSWELAAGDFKVA